MAGGDKDLDAFTNDEAVPAADNADDITALQMTSPVPRPPKRLLADLSPRKPIKRRRRGDGCRIATFAFLDLETTGLFPNQVDFADPRKLDDPAKLAYQLHKNVLETPNGDRPRITEISIVAVGRDSFCMAVEKMKEADREGGRLPTAVVTSVHTRQIQPELTEEMWKKYESNRRPEKQRLTQRVLREKREFSVEWPGVRHFLESLVKPVAIVAHNGIGFDLRVLHSEIQRAGLQDNWLPDDVFFVDSCVAIREIDSSNLQSISAVVDGVDWSKLQMMRATAISDIPEAVAAEEGNGAEKGNLDVVAETIEEALNVTVDVDLVARSRPTGLVTPQRPPRPVGSLSAPAKLSSRCLFPEAEKEPCHPIHFLKSDEWTIAKRRRLQAKFFRRVSGKWEFSRGDAAVHNSRVGAFRQENIYYSIFGEYYDAHQAQADCEALMQIALAYGDSFLKYADDMAADIII